MPRSPASLPSRARASRLSLTKGGDRGGRLVDVEPLERRDDAVSGAGVLLGVRVEDAAPADGQRRGVAADHEAVSPGGEDRGLQAQLRQRLLPRQQDLPVEEDDAAEHLRGAQVQAHAGALDQLLRAGRQQAQARVYHEGRREHPALAQHVAAADLVLLDPRQVYRRPVPGGDRGDGAAVLLQAADAQPPAFGLGFDRSAPLQLAREHGAGADHAEPLDDEGAVDRQPERSAGPPLPGGGDQLLQGLPQLPDSGAGKGGDPDHPGPFEEGSGDQLGDLLFHQLQPVLVDEIDLVDDDDPPLHAEQLQHVEVLPRLRHDPVVRGDHHQGGVDGADAGDHRLDEALVPRDVDDRRLLPEEGETELYGDAARLLLGSAVGVGAGEGLDQQGLAVVDVTGGSNYRVCHDRGER